MDGLYNYKVQEPIFREYLQGLDIVTNSQEWPAPMSFYA